MSRNQPITRTIAYSLLPIFVGLLLMVSNVSAQGGKKPSTSAPTSEPNAILLMSVPGGLRVYLGPDTVKSNSGQENEVGLGMDHPIIAEKYMKGTTPVLVRNVRPGKYLLGIVPIRIVDREHRVADIDKTMIVTGFVSHTPLQELPRSRKEVMGAAIYSITKEETYPHQILVLAIHPSTSLAKLDSLYPATPRFHFDETAFLQELRERPDMPKSFFTEDDQHQVVNLLRRGGKVVFSKGDFTFLSEITRDAQWTMKMTLQTRERK